MKVLIELNFEAPTVPADVLLELGSRIYDALSGWRSGPRAIPKLLIELTPNYLEMPIHIKPTRTVAVDK